MSKSIKQYKDAMDKIKASENFMDRTEELLKDAVKSETEIALGQPKTRRARNITITAGMGLAACIIAVLAVRSGFIQDTDDITSDSAAEVTSVTEVTEEGTEPVFLDIQDDSQMEALEQDMPETLPDDHAESPDNGGSEEVADEEKPAEDVSPVTAAAVPTETKPVSDKAAPEAVSPAAETEGTATTSKPAHSAGTLYGDEEAVEDDAESFDADDVGSVTTDATSSDPLISSLYSLDYTVCTVDIQSCTKDGEAESLRLSGDEAQNTVSNIASILSDSVTFDPGSGFVSEFVLNISDVSDGEGIFTIYITDNQFVVVTRHFSDRQERTTYLLKRNSYEALEKMMYLNFGTESDFEAFMALKSGK